MSEFIDGVTYYNDSKATNTDSAIKALEAFTAPIVLLAGGHDKMTPLADFMAEVKKTVKDLVLMGEAADRFEAAARDAPPLKQSRTSAPNLYVRQ